MRYAAPAVRRRDTAAEAASPREWVSLRMPRSTRGKLCPSARLVTLGAGKKGVFGVASIILSGHRNVRGIPFALSFRAAEPDPVAGAPIGRVTPVGRANRSGMFCHRQRVVEPSVVGLR